MTGWRLVSDVGGTNVRFARAAEGKGLQQRRSYPVARFPTFSSALRAYLDDTGSQEGCTGIAIGAAGLVSLGAVKLTNTTWEISEAEISATYGAPCTLINDVEAVAYALPALSSTDFVPLGSIEPRLSTARRLLVANIGTGFGAATLIRSASGWTSCPSEAGHMSLTVPEWAGNSLQQKFTSVEHVLSGGGFCNLHAAIANTVPVNSPALIIAQARSDAHSAQALRVFTQVAGNVLGNLVLAVAAWDGIFLCGSVAKGFSQVADFALLRQHFEGTGRMSEWKKRVPIALLTMEDAALAGLAAV